MRYSPSTIEQIQTVLEKEHFSHGEELVALLKRQVPFSELFTYGLQYLPNITDPATQLPNLSLLEGYEPEVVTYFDMVAEIEELPEILKDLATEFAVFANGESVQIDEYYYQLNPAKELEKALKLI